MESAPLIAPKILNALHGKPAPPHRENVLETLAQPPQPALLTSDLAPPLASLENALTAQPLLELTPIAPLENSAPLVQLIHLKLLMKPDHAMPLNAPPETPIAPP